MWGFGADSKLFTTKFSTLYNKQWIKNQNNQVHFRGWVFQMWTDSSKNQWKTIFEL